MYLWNYFLYCMVDISYISFICQQNKVQINKLIPFILLREVFLSSANIRHFTILLFKIFFICTFLPLFRQSKSPTPADIYQSQMNKQNNFSLYIENSKHHKKLSLPSFSPSRKKSKGHRDDTDVGDAKVKYEKHERSGHEKNNMNRAELKIVEKRYLIISFILVKV